MTTELTTTGTYTPDQIALLKRTICRGASNDEFALFLHICKRTGLDPFARQIYALKRWTRGEGEKMTFQTGIDGYRLIADRTGHYAPGKESTFAYGKDGRLYSATAYVKKLTSDGQWHEVAATAHYSEYVGLTKDGKETHMWASKPHIMLAKCAEALALRRAFPDNLSGVYTSDEMPEATPEQPANDEPPAPPRDRYQEWVDGLSTEDRAEWLENIALAKEVEHNAAGANKLLDLEEGTASRPGINKHPILGPAFKKYRENRAREWRCQYVESIGGYEQMQGNSEPAAASAGPYSEGV